MFYPEVTPFAVLTLCLYGAIEWIRARRFPGGRVVMIEYALIGLVVLLRHNLISFFYTLAGQLAGGVKAGRSVAVAVSPSSLIPLGAGLGVRLPAAQF